jgi:hypothetical protein
MGDSSMKRKEGAPTAIVRNISEGNKAAGAVQGAPGETPGDSLKRGDIALLTGHRLG